MSVPQGKTVREVISLVLTLTGELLNVVTVNGAPLDCDKPFEDTYESKQQLFEFSSE